MEVFARDYRSVETGNSIKISLFVHDINTLECLFKDFTGYK